MTGAARTHVCTVGEVAPGEKRFVRGGRRDLLLCRAADGEFYAVGTVCPHQGAPLELGRLGGTAIADGVGRYRYGLDGEVLRCPWHGWEFDVKTGQSLFGEASARIATYEVTIEDGDLFVADAPNRRTHSTERKELA